MISTKSFGSDTHHSKVRQKDNKKQNKKLSNTYKYWIEIAHSEKTRRIGVVRNNQLPPEV